MAKSIINPLLIGLQVGQGLLGAFQAGTNIALAKKQEGRAQRQVGLLERQDARAQSKFEFEQDLQKRILSEKDRIQDLQKGIGQGIDDKPEEEEVDAFSELTEDELFMIGNTSDEEFKIYIGKLNDKNRANLLIKERLKASKKTASSEVSDILSNIIPKKTATDKIVTPETTATIGTSESLNIDPLRSDIQDPAERIKTITEDISDSRGILLPGTETTSIESTVAQLPVMQIDTSSKGIISRAFNTDQIKRLTEAAVKNPSLFMEKLPELARQATENIPASIMTRIGGVETGSENKLLKALQETFNPVFEQQRKIDIITNQSKPDPKSEYLRKAGISRSDLNEFKKPIEIEKMKSIANEEISKMDFSGIPNVDANEFKRIIGKIIAQESSGGKRNFVEDSTGFAVSPMQVRIGLHAPEITKRGLNVKSPEDVMRYGIRYFKSLLDRTKSIDGALKRYHGSKSKTANDTYIKGVNNQNNTIARSGLSSLKGEQLVTGLNNLYNSFYG